MINGPPGPVHAYVKGPAEPATLKSMAPLKGATQRLLAVVTLLNTMVGVMSFTVTFAVAVHPLLVSVTNTEKLPSSTAVKSSLDEVNPLGPVHENVKGPALPVMVIAMAPLNGDVHLLLLVVELTVIVGEVLTTVMGMLAEHTEKLSSTVRI